MPAEISLLNKQPEVAAAFDDLSAAEAREQNCYLTTTGRVSGRPHEIEIWFAVDPEHARVLYLLSGGRDRADWVRNIRVESTVRVRVGERVYAGTGRWVAEASEEDARARRVVADKYGENPDGALSNWARTSLPVAIDLTARLEGAQSDA